MSDTVLTGHALDRAVAERVMKWRPSRPGGKYWCDREEPQQGGNGLRTWEWSPSTNMRDAWQVVERLRVLRWDVTVIAYAESGFRAIVTASTRRLVGGESWKTAGEAICLAALKAMEA